jgi:hypothetical protein
MMKKTPSTKAVKELRAEYHFDYRQSRPNRFADQIDTTAVVVVLDPMWLKYLLRRSPSIPLCVH